MSTTIAELKSIANLAMPRHVAIIMDGNGRWAEKRGKLRLFGHKNAIKAVRESVQCACECGIERLTLFAFSSENWRRPEAEVLGLMDLFSWALTHELKSLSQSGVILRVIGDISRFSAPLQAAIKNAERNTAQNTGLVLNIAVNYGGRWDILNATKILLQDIIESSLNPNDITEQDLTSRLCEPMDVDLLIRTGGEKRISNFLMWQLAYAELYFSDVLWPDFDALHFKDALAYYSTRQRRFGCTSSQITEKNEE